MQEEFQGKANEEGPQPGPKSKDSSLDPQQGRSLPPLPFATDALEPHISAETLHFHHDKHHRSYVDKMNELAAAEGMASFSLEEIILRAEGKLFHNAAQTWNHNFFWKCLSPRFGQEPEGELRKAIERQYQSIEGFQKEFTEKAIELFGSGWTWLSMDEGGALTIEPLPNDHLPLKKGHHALLTCDVWEHAYYLDYQNDRPKFLEHFWHVVNWEFVSAEFAAATRH